MKISKKDMLLYVVTDRSWLGNKSLTEQVENALEGGATLIQLREKEITFEEFVSIAKEIKAITDRYQVPFIINDNLEVALAVNADGVHIGQGDEDIKIAREKLGQSKIIGLSAHNVEEALKAVKQGADYIGVGAVFGSSTKLDANTITYETVQNICKAVEIPVVAIGGITKDNIHKLTGTGVDGVAVISAVFAQPDIKRATMELLTLSKQMVGK